MVYELEPIIVRQDPQTPFNKEDFQDLFAAVGFLAGGKRLTVDFVLGLHTCHDQATCYLKNIGSGGKVPGATTALYKEAYRMMQVAADLRRRPVEYMFTTENPQMKLWAQDEAYGAGIFNWDRTDPSNPPRFRAYKTFYPQV